MPLKQERDCGRPVVAQEDFAAFNLLAELARDLQLGAEVEYIPLGGVIDLNRDDLIVICGPRISPLIADVLTADPVLRFEVDDQGQWFLTDRKTGRSYHSPMNEPEPEPGDVGYLARHVRPDGRGTFVLLTGIHAVGSHGIIHYLQRHLADLYQQVGTQRFSTLIGCQYDPDKRLVTSSQRLTPLYLHEAT